MRVFLFHQNLVTDHTKIQGHTGGSFFFTRIWSPTIPKFRDIQEGLSFSPEFGHRPYQNSGAYRRVFLFHRNLVTDRTKIQGPTGGSFLFTRILKKKHLLKKCVSFSKCFFFSKWVSVENISNLALP